MESQRKKEGFFMAQYTQHFTGSFDRLLDHIDETVMGGSISASREGEGTGEINGVRFVTRVYERYSWLGDNRLSLTVTLFGRDGDLHLSAITAGGSRGVFLKVNTWGEESFLEKFVKKIENYSS